MRYSRLMNRSASGALVARIARVPLELLADAVGDVAQVIGLGEPAGVLEVAGRRRAGLAGVNPLGVMAERLRDGRRRGVKSLNLLPGSSTCLP